MKKGSKAEGDVGLQDPGGPKSKSDCRKPRRSSNTIQANPKGSISGAGILAGRFFLLLFFWLLRERPPARMPALLPDGLACLYDHRRDKQPAILDQDRPIIGAFGKTGER